MDRFGYGLVGCVVGEGPRQLFFAAEVQQQDRWTEVPDQGGGDTPGRLRQPRPPFGRQEDQQGCLLIREDGLMNPVAGIHHVPIDRLRGNPSHQRWPLGSHAARLPGRLLRRDGLRPRGAPIPARPGRLRPIGPFLPGLRILRPPGLCPHRPGRFPYRVGLGNLFGVLDRSIVQVNGNHFKCRVVCHGR